MTEGAPERLLIGGEWVEGTGETFEVRSPYDGRLLGVLPAANSSEVDDAVGTAVCGAETMAAMPAHRRASLLYDVAALIERDRDPLARTIAAESGKALKFALGEVGRGGQTFRFAAEEAKRIHGETVPMDAGRGSERRMGFWVRVPKGVVAAISPFNFPLNLVAHKVAPALAAGNSVVLKPASSTPLTALHLGRLLVEAGAPPGAVNIVTGSGSTVGDVLVTDPRVALVSFTGSASVGMQILRQAGLKRVILELGSNSPVIVAADAEFSKVFPSTVVGSFANSGQICLSVQRLYVHESRFDEFTERFVARTKALRLGDPLDPTTDVGPMISQKEAERAEHWIQEAVAAGSSLLAGGTRTGALLAPTVLTDVPLEMKVMSLEAFAPLVSLIPFSDIEEAFRLANDTSYGLQAGVFNESIDTAFRAVRALEYGGVMVNDTSNYRVDHMPYGGVKGSGLGREGVRFAVEEMTEIRMVVFNL